MWGHAVRSCQHTRTACARPATHIGTAPQPHASIPLLPPIHPGHYPGVSAPSVPSVAGDSAVQPGPAAGARGARCHRGARAATQIRPRLAPAGAREGRGGARPAAVHGSIRGGGRYAGGALRAGATQCRASSVLAHPDVARQRARTQLQPTSQPASQHPCVTQLASNRLAGELVRPYLSRHAAGAPSAPPGRVPHSAHLAECLGHGRGWRPAGRARGGAAAGRKQLGGSCGGRH
jgi:hypothetical protein